MPNTSIIREITPLGSENCFLYVSRTKKEFTFPIHFHPECELNFIENAKGVKRIVGDSIEEIEDVELVLITGSNLEHAWMNGTCKSECIQEITIQFHEDLFINILTRDQFSSIREMFEKAKYGLVFSIETAVSIKPLLMDIEEEKNGFQSFIKLMQLMYTLSLEKQVRILSSTTFFKTDEEPDSRRVKKVLIYLEQNYKEEIRLSDLAELVGMSEAAFCRFFKKRTAKTLTDYLIYIRLGNATRMLVDTSHSISEISYLSGFNNLSYFNRIFKKHKGCTPKQFRENYSKTKIMI